MLDSSFDFALDPALGGASSSRSRPDIYANGYQEESDEEDEGGAENGVAGDDSEKSEDETDAEDEYTAGLGQDVRGPVDGALKRKRTDKGKEREDSNDFDAAGDYSQVGGENADELNRLITAIREPDTGDGGRGAFDKVYDRTIEEELEGIDDPFGETAVKRRGRRAVADLDPSPEVEVLLRKANTHYGVGEFAEAIEILTEVIRIDPSVRKAWVSLATNHEELENHEKALKFKIVAAHLMSAKSAAKEWASLGCQSRDRGLLPQAIYCFTQAVRGDKNDVDSMWDRAILLKMAGNPRQAIIGFTSVLVVHPNDPGVLRELLPLLRQAGNISKATTLARACFDYFRETYPYPEDDPDGVHFGASDLSMLAACLIEEKNYSEAVHVLRTGARWLQGRIKQASWDALADDREFDLTRKSRPDFLKEPRAQREAEVFDLDLMLRLRLGVARLLQGRKSEAKYHFNVVFESEPAEIPELYGIMAESYMEVGLWNEAIETFSQLTNSEDIGLANVWARMGECYKELGDYTTAINCFRRVVKEDLTNLDAKMQLAKCYELDGNQAKAWALISEVRVATQKQRELDAAEVASGRAPRKRQDQSNRIHISKEDRRKADAARLMLEQQTSAEYAIAFEQLEGEYVDAFHDEDDSRADWLGKATMLVDAFRETRALFPSDKFKKYTGALGRKWKRKGAKNDLATEMDELTRRLERSQAKDTDDDLEIDAYRGITFDRWIAMMCKYALVMTLNGEAEAAQETLAHVSDAAPFVQSAAHSLTLRLVRCSCYLHVKDYANVVTIGRWIWLRYQYQTDPVRLLQAMLGGSVNAVNAWNNSALQKFTIRQIKDIELIAEGAETTVTNKGNLALSERVIGKKKKKSTKGKKKASRDDEEEVGEDSDDDEEGEAEGDMQEHGLVKRFKPSVMNPIYLIAYGTILMTSMSYKSAIVYLLRAFDLVPDQPLLCLYLGIAYSYRAMQRQSDNRHYQITTGSAFFDQYRELRGDCQESAYNLGRACHQLTLYATAAEHYERVLEMAEQERDPNAMEQDDDDEVKLDPNDFSKVAAYNLSQIYLLDDNREGAIALSRKWLSI